MGIHIEQYMVGPNGRGGNQCTFDDLMWGFFQQYAILEGTGFIFIAVADDVFIQV